MAQRDDESGPLAGGNGNGFKLGGPKSPEGAGGGLILGNVAFNNRRRGFNYNTAENPM